MFRGFVQEGLSTFVFFLFWWGRGETRAWFQDFYGAEACRSASGFGFRVAAFRFRPVEVP